MIRKVFKDHAGGKINDGCLAKTKQQYYVRFMKPGEAKLNLALQENVMQTLRAMKKIHYIIPKDEAYLHNLLAKGNAIIGTFIKSDTPGTPDRLAAHMLVVYPKTEKETGLADPNALPHKKLEDISVVSNVLVHQDFRGNKMMQHMLQHWLYIAAMDDKKDALAEVCTDNEFSWGVFLDCGFAIYAHGHDSRDGSDLVYVHKPLDREFVYSSAPGDTSTLRLFDSNGAVIASAHRQLNNMLDQGFHATGYDRKTQSLRMEKCIGTRPLNQLKNAPRGPINDNRPR